MRRNSDCHPMTTSRFSRLRHLRLVGWRGLRNQQCQPHLELRTKNVMLARRVPAMKSHRGEHVILA